MKTRRTIQALILCTPVALTGCVGMNTTLFMTKSNAGLDLDAKPPTAEINISRKEGVVEPSFEDGKTPVVMASFSVKSGTSGMSRFFSGVNQTFAGGDAALTMSKLYDRTNDYSEIGSLDDEGKRKQLRDLFNAGVPLSQPVKKNSKKGFLGLRKVLFGLAEPGEVRPFFFGTDTQLGVKVAWNGVGGPYPDNVKIGFNRKEMAVAPVTISDQNIVNIPSFLATVDTDVSGSSAGTNQIGGNLGVEWLQYFATGEAASSLAREYGVRRAMLERADPKAISAQDKRYQKFKSEHDQQKAAFDQIEKAFDTGNHDRKNDIIKKGKAVFNFPDDTNSNNFIKRLAFEIDGSSENTPKFKDLQNKIKL